MADRERNGSQGSFAQMAGTGICGLRANRVPGQRQRDWRCRSLTSICGTGRAWRASAGSRSAPSAHRRAGGCSVRSESSWLPPAPMGSQRRTAVVANACAAGSWTRFRISIPAIAMTRAATQPSKNAFILSLPRLNQRAIYTTQLAAGKLIDRAGTPRVLWFLTTGIRADAGVGPLRCTLRNRSRPCKFIAGPVSASEALRDIIENDPVLRGTLSCWQRPGSARAN